MKVSAVCTITKSLPIRFSTFVNCSLLANFGYINLFYKKDYLKNSRIVKLRLFCLIGQTF
ncbi:hypothetical protein DSC47_01125 [Elizabethkingia miricola]|nr:hypothetical protein DSC47_01125 [Elizabethkingia miricola]